MGGHVMGLTMPNVKKLYLRGRILDREAGSERDGESAVSRLDSGFSIVEVICAITLIGVLVIPLVQAMFTSIAASSTTREVAEIETVLQNAADRVNRAPIGCDYDIYVEAAALSKGWPASLATATYQYYLPGSSAEASTPGSWAPGGCPGGVRTPGLLQLVTVTIESTSGRVQRSIEVIKSDV